MSTIAYPLKMAPALDRKPWGGSRLSTFGKQLPDDRIGESLESGSDSRVENGRLRGQTLGAIVRTHAQSLLGSRGALASAGFADFPLLIKLIDANQNLSVQVHPGDEIAPKGKRGKTEAWLVLAAASDARLVTGIDGNPDSDRIDQQIISEPVKAGDVFFIPAGTVHAIGAGVLLYEVQQNSDVTYRLYDWGRVREMHWNEGIRAAAPDQRARRVRILALSAHREMVVACRYFALERWSVEGEMRVESSPSVFRVMTVVDGSLTLAGVEAQLGDTVVLPADLPESLLDGHASVLVAYIPDLAADVIAPLLAAGHSRGAIDALGAAW